MGVSDLDPDAHGGRPLNAGNMAGAKRPLKPATFGRSAFFSMNTAGCVIVPFSIWRSIANYAAVILSK
jgi:hypothetical protein